jgi:hypothetical protein
MNFTNYDGLKSAIEKWLMRPDLVEDIPQFIQLAEAMLSRRLRTRQMVLRARIEAKSRYLRLPTGWRKAWNVQRVEDDFPLEYLSPVEMDKMRFKVANNLVPPMEPCTYYSLFGDTIEFLPEPSLANPINMEMLYYAKILPLTDSNPSNWLLLTHPDLYLYGALIHSAPFLREDERVPVWRENFEEALAAANLEDTDSKRSGAPMVMPNRTF